ncbi:hypothetical protein HK102_012020, partial [Quaeritorhiza haematococci]
MSTKRSRTVLERPQLPPPRRRERDMEDESDASMILDRMDRDYEEAQKARRRRGGANGQANEQEPGENHDHQIPNQGQGQGHQKSPSFSKEKVELSSDDEDGDDGEGSCGEDSEEEEEEVSCQCCDKFLSGRLFGCFPLIVRRLFLASFISTVFLLPGTLDKILDGRKKVYEFRLFFWSLVFSISAFSLFFLQTIIDIIFSVLYRRYGKHINSRRLERIDMLSPLRGYIAFAIWGFLVWMTWVLLLERECSEIVDQTCRQQAQQLVVSQGATNVTSSLNCYVPLGCLPPEMMKKNFHLWWVSPATFAFGISATFLFLEKLALKIITSQIHKTAYANRIVESRFAAWVLDVLRDGRRRFNKMPYNARSMKSPPTMTVQPSDGPKTSVGDSDDLFDVRQYQQNSAFPSPRTPLARRTSDASTIVNSAHSGGVYIPSQVNPSNLASQASSLIANELFTSSSQRILRSAYKTFSFLCPPGCSQITLAEFRPFFADEIEAQRAFEIFDKDHSG